MPNLTCHTCEIGGFSSSADNVFDLFVTRATLKTMLNVVRTKKKLLNYRCCKFVKVPNSKLNRGRGVIAVSDNFGSAFPFGDRTHGPTCLGRTIRNANNMPKHVV